MSIQHAVTAVAQYGAVPEDFENFRRHIEAGWLEEALDATGTATIRKRRLPAEQVVWLVIGMALFRNRRIEEVVNSLDLALPAHRGASVAPSAIPQARARLGAAPIQWLFERCGSAWATRSAETHRWRGLSVFGIDGSTLRVADSQENRDTFGGHSAGSERGESGYPLVRLVALMALRSHLLAKVNVGPFKGTSEKSLTRGLLAAIPDDSLTVLDRNFLNAPTLIPLSRGGRNRHWLTRAKSNTRWRVVRSLGPGDDRVEMKVSGAARRADPSLPPVFPARAVQYQRKGFRPQTLLTSMLSPNDYPAAEVVLLYHERWEIELGYDEVKTELLDREETLRSKKPENVYQEIWGLLLAFNLVRMEMEGAAEALGVPPTRLSFVLSLSLIQNEWLWLTVTQPGAIPRRLLDLRANLQRLLLPPRRSERSYPRAVKIKMSSYARKRPTTIRETLP